MPELDEVTNNLPDTSEDGGGAGGGGNAAGITKEEFEKSRRESAEQISALRETVDRLTNVLVNRDVRPPAPQVDDTPPPPSEDDDPDTRAAKISARMVHQALKPLQNRLDQVVNVGFGRMGQIATEVAMPKLKYYGKYKKQIDELVAGLSPDQKANPDSIKHCHDFVVSQHLDELIGESTESAVREKVKGMTPSAPSPERIMKEKGIPTPEELGFTRAQIAAVEARGGWEKWVIKSTQGRFKNYEEWALARKAQLR